MILITVNQELIDRMDKFTHKTGGCWLWIGAKISSGYGCLSIKNKTFSAHRVAWIINNGDIEDGLCVLHKCDNPVCVNPDHLFTGTNKDNVDDREAKGRGYARFKQGGNKFIGSENGSSKLCERDVLHIKTMLAENVSQKEIAKIYNVTPPCISSINRGINWGWLTTTANHKEG